MDLNGTDPKMIAGQAILKLRPLLMDPIVQRVATKFRTRKELQTYLHEHPDAERSEHSVMSPAEAHRYYEEHKKDAAIAERVAEQLLGAPKKPKVVPGHVPRHRKQIKKIHGLETASSTINSPITLAEQAGKAVAAAKVSLVVPKDYNGQPGVENLPVQMVSHPSSGNFEGNKPGHATFDFVVITRDARGKTVSLPLEGVHLFMAWQPNYRSDAAGGGLGHRYIDRLYVSEGRAARRQPRREAEAAPRAWYTQTYKHEPELVKAAGALDPLAARVAARYLRGSIPEAAHQAGIEYLKKAPTCTSW